MASPKATMQTLTLQEYQECTVAFLLNKEQLAALASAHIGVTPSPDEWKTWVLRPTSYVGALRTGGLAIVVRPKIPIDRVMFLVAYALDPKNWRRDGFDLKRESDILESIVLAFTHHTRQAVRRGLLQGYRREEEALHTVRGRIRFDEQIKRRFGVPLPIEVAFDEFTEDIEENRLLKAALHRLARLPVRSTQPQQEVQALRPVFDAVQIASYPRGTPHIQYTRLNSHYRPAVELARLVIDNSSLELFHGDVTGASFMLDMNKVFEQFLFVALGEALALSPSQWQTQVPLTLDEANAIHLFPDLLWQLGNHPIFVGDAKYKRITSTDFPNADIYQILAYCTAANLPSGLLIYAAEDHARGGHDVKHCITNANKTIELAAIDLSGQPEDILKQVKDLACRVERQAGRRSSRKCEHPAAVVGV